MGLRVRNSSAVPVAAAVATSSMGASIKNHIADFVMPPEMITRAFLAVWAWRRIPSVRALLVQTYGPMALCVLRTVQVFGRVHVTWLGKRWVQSEQQGVDHSGATDRNAFLYAMLRWSSV